MKMRRIREIEEVFREMLRMVAKNEIYWTSQESKENCPNDEMKQTLVRKTYIIGRFEI